LLVTVPETAEFRNFFIAQNHEEVKRVIEDRIKDIELRKKITTAENAALFIKNGMTIATSGFTPSGYPKATPLALSKRIKNNNENIKITLITGASVGDELDGELARNNITKKRIPYQTNDSCRKAINNGDIQFCDVHLSLLPQYINYNYLEDIDIGIVEASEITENGCMIPTTSVGITPTIVKKAKKLIIEINTSQPIDLRGIHDIYTLPNPPKRTPIPILNCKDRIGTNYIQIDKNKIIAIVFTDIRDDVKKLAEPNKDSNLMAEIFLEFLDHEIKAGRIPRKLLPFQSGVGSVSNSILNGFSRSKYDNLQFYSEVIQDSMLDLIDIGKVQIASGTAISPSPEGLNKFYDDIKRYKSKIILRPQEISNNPEIIRRLGVIAMNTAIEVDIYGNVNSSNIMGGNLMNGIGGSGDFARNAYLSVFFTKSTAKNETISTVVPLVSHVDHTEHDVNIIITEQGIADLRGLSPKERAISIINNCANPIYKDLLSDYLKEAMKSKKNIPILLNRAFKCFESLEKTDTMKRGNIVYYANLINRKGDDYEEKSK
jgi:succinyl-CoA:acetate CoA-transferase